MHILVLNCSPKKQYSLTYRTALFLEKMFPDDTFQFIFTEKGILPDEHIQAFKDADLILFTSSLYHCGLHGPMYNLLNDITQKIGLDLKNKKITHLTTNEHILDYHAMKSIEMFADMNNMRFLPGLSMLDMEVLPVRDCDNPAVKFHGMEKLYCWFRFIRLCIRGCEYFKTKAEVAIVDTSDPQSNHHEYETELMKTLLKEAGANVTVYDLKNAVSANCNSCSMCYNSQQCVIHDNFDQRMTEIYDNKDIVIFTGEIQYGSYSHTYKEFLDRSVQAGRHPAKLELIELFVYFEQNKTHPDNHAAFEEHSLQMSEYRGCANVGTVNGCDSSRLKNKLQELICAYNADIMPQETGRSRILLLSFARVAAEIRALCPADYEYYKKIGLLDEEPANPSVKPVLNAQDSATSLKMRCKPFEIVLEHFNGHVDVQPRRQDKNIPILDRLRKTE